MFLIVVVHLQYRIKQYTIRQKPIYTMERESFIFYRSFFEGIEELPESIQLAVLQKLCRYALYGELNDSDDVVVKSIFKFIKPQIDANNERYLNGKKGGKSGILAAKTKRGRKEVDESQAVVEEVPTISEEKSATEVPPASVVEAPKAEECTTKKLSFNFRKALIAEGFSPSLVEDWMRIRKEKKAINSQRAFHDFCCEVSKVQMDKNQLLEHIVKRQWKGFEANWLSTSPLPANGAAPIIELAPDGTPIGVSPPAYTYNPKNVKPLQTNYVAGRQTLIDFVSNGQGW